MVIQVVEFSSGGTKLERFLPNNQHSTHQKLTNFENQRKAELLQLNRTQFPSLGTFVIKKVGHQKK